MENSNHLSAIRRCTGCGRFENEPLGVNKNGEPYLACCPDSRYRNITAVQWLVEQINGYSYGTGLPSGMNVRIDIPKDIIEKGLEMEKKQIVEAYNGKVSDTSHLVRKSFIENTSVGEQYYNETMASDLTPFEEAKYILDRIALEAYSDNVDLSNCKWEKRVGIFVVNLLLKEVATDNGEPFNKKRFNHLRKVRTEIERL